MKIIKEIIVKTIVILFIAIQVSYLAFMGMGGTMLMLVFNEINGLQCFMMSVPIIPMLVCQKYLFPLYERVLR